MSVHFHVLSSHSKGLFHGAISESGSALMPLFFREHGMLSQAQRLAEAVGCPTENSKELVSCLRKVDVETIMRNQPNDVSMTCLLELWALIYVMLVSGWTRTRLSYINVVNICCTTALTRTWTSSIQGLRISKYKQPSLATVLQLALLYTYFTTCFG
jgi:hypothetical protein